MDKKTSCKICGDEVIITKEEQSYNPFLFCTNCFYDYMDRMENGEKEKINDKHSHT